jgi:hypothetical protein
MELNLRIKIKIKKRIVFLIEEVEHKLRNINKIIRIIVR